MTAPILNGYLLLADNKGNALTGHTLAFYFPGTTTPKPVWLDRARTQPAANPLTIDATGRVRVFGSGLYRQVLRTQTGQLVWDGETSCADETVSRWPPRLARSTQAGSAEADLICPGAENGPGGQLGTVNAPLLQAGDYLLASTADSQLPELSVFPRARIVSISPVTGHVVFDTVAWRSRTCPSPLFIKAA